MKLFFQSRFQAAGQYHFGELVDSSKDSHSRLCQKKINFEGIFVYVWTVKLVHFIYIGFFYTYYLVESPEYMEKCTIFL